MEQEVFIYGTFNAYRDGVLVIFENNPVGSSVVKLNPYGNVGREKDDEGGFEDIINREDMLKCC